jgi:hypothetical protein
VDNIYNLYAYRHRILVTSTTKINITDKRLYIYRFAFAPVTKNVYVPALLYRSQKGRMNMFTK